MKRRASIVVVAAVLSSCGGSATPPPSVTPSIMQQTPSATVTSSPPGTPTASPCEVAAQSPPAGTITANYPTAFAFAPDGRLFYSERSGTVRVWENGGAAQFASVSTVTTESNGGYSERGLLGLAISPTFASDRYVYAFYSDPNRTQQHVIRWTDCAGKGTNSTVLLTFPSGSDCCHKGGRLAFGADGKLYVTLGEEHTASAAQSTGDVRGKVLRYNPDGSVPADNPFGANNPVWAYGFRNPFGMAFSGTGQLAITNNGPSGDAGSPGTGYDTMVLAVARGGGYEWPLCYGYGHTLQASSCGAQHDPDWSSENSTVIPTGAAFVDAAGPAPYAGHLVFCTYRGGMRVVTAGSPHASVSNGPSECRLDVKQGPDHALYYSDTGHIYRLG